MNKGYKGIIVLASAMILLSGCGNSDSWKAKAKAGEEKITALHAQVDDLQFKLDSMVVTEVTQDTSLQVIEGSKVLEFKYIDDKLILPNKLQLPFSFEDVNNSHVMVGSMFKFKPSSNWVSRLEGTTLHLNHPSKIRGVIKSVGSKERVEEGAMKDIIQPFFADFPSTTINYRSLFVDDYTTGIMARADIQVEGKKHMLSAGFVTLGEYGLLFSFEFEDDGSGTQEELIDLLLSSGRYGDMSLKLE